MSIFAKKPDPNPSVEPEFIKQPAPSNQPAPSRGAPAYGIADAIQLMRSLPVEQNAPNMELVVRVVRATLGSLNVRVEDIIEDATRKQKSIQEGISSLHAQVADLEKQLEARRREIAAHEAELKETTTVKDRLLLTEKAAGHWARQTSGSGPHNQAAGLPAPATSGRAPLPKPSDREDSGTTKAG